MTQAPNTTNTLFGMELGVDITPITQKLLQFRQKISKRNFLLEFGSSFLNYAEAKYIERNVIFTKIERTELDVNAIEKGAPTDPQKMSEFLKQIISENNIYAKRTAVVIPPEAAFNKTVYLPEDILPENAKNYILDTKSGFQFPIPLKNTDFDLTPLNIFRKNNSKIQNAFFLTSVPKKITDNIIKSLALADLELTRLEVAYTSQIRLIHKEINTLKFDEYVILLELRNECTYVSIFGGLGIVDVYRIAAIRDSPFSNTKSKTTERENYLPISYLDLRILLNELSAKISSIRSRLKKNIIKRIYLNGINSCHKGIEKIIQEKLQLQTSLIDPYSIETIRDINNNSSFHIQSMNRLIGLGILSLEMTYDRNESFSTKIEEKITKQSKYPSEIIINNNLNSKNEEKIFNINTDSQKKAIISEEFNQKIQNKSINNERIIDQKNKIDVKETITEFDKEITWPSINDKKNIQNPRLDKEDLTDIAINNKTINEKDPKTIIETKKSPQKKIETQLTQERQESKSKKIENDSQIEVDKKNKVNATNVFNQGKILTNNNLKINQIKELEKEDSEDNLLDFLQSSSTTKKEQSNSFEKEKNSEKINLNKEDKVIPIKNEEKKKDIEFNMPDI